MEVYPLKWDQSWIGSFWVLFLQKVEMLYFIKLFRLVLLLLFVQEFTLIGYRTLFKHSFYLLRAQLIWDSFLGHTHLLPYRWNRLLHSIEIHFLDFLLRGSTTKSKFLWTFLILIFSSYYLFFVSDCSSWGYSLNLIVVV